MKLLCLLAMVLLAGCSPSMEDYKAMVRDGIKTVPHVQEIKKMFPGEPTDHFITYYGFDKTKPVTWNTEVFFGGKYVFTYQIDVIVDYHSNRILGITNSPEFFLVRVSRVFDDTPENIGADFDADDKFGESDWEKVVAAKGDSSVIGIQVNTNSPVPRFEDYVRAIQRDRVQVE